MKLERNGDSFSGCPLPTTAKCLVCEHPDGGSAHFGSTSCLACAAFFRRTVSLNINFMCKKEKMCIIFHELRMICRACRFDKCVKAGMRRECVQKRRSNKKVPKKHMIKEEIKMELMDDFTLSDEQMDTFHSPISLENIKKSPPEFVSTMDSPEMTEYNTSDIPSTSTSIPRSDQMTPDRQSNESSKILSMNGEEVLRFYVDQMKSSMDRRRMIFTDSALLAVVEDRGDMPFEAANPAPHSLKRQYESQRFDNMLAYDFCKACPGFDLLDQMERAIFYRSCSLAYCLLDIAWITVQAYPVEREEPFMMYTDGSVCTINNMSYGWDNEEDINAEEKQKLFLGFVKRFNEQICRPIRDIKLTQVEFAALKGLCIWKLGYCEFSPGMKVIGKEHEEAILNGLHNYYEDLYESSDEISTRLGNLILLMGTVFEMNQLIMETYKSAELFALFKLDALSKSLLTL